jgi:hypothetical protein
MMKAENGKWNSCEATGEAENPFNGSIVQTFNVGFIRTHGLKFAGESETLRSQNTFFWNEIVDDAMI